MLINVSLSDAVLLREPVWIVIVMNQAGLMYFARFARELLEPLAKVQGSAGDSWQCSCPGMWVHVRASSAAVCRVRLIAEIRFGTVERIMRVTPAAGGAHAAGYRVIARPGLLLIQATLLTLLRWRRGLRVAARRRSSRSASSDCSGCRSRRVVRRGAVARGGGARGR